MSAQYFSNIDLNDVVDPKRDKFFSLHELEDKLPIIKSASQFYLDPTSSTYIKQGDRNRIDLVLNELQGIVTRLSDTRSQDPTVFASNKQPWLNQFDQYYDELLDLLIRPYLAFAASSNPKSRIDRLNELITEAENNARILKTRAAEQANAAAKSAETTVGRFFINLLDDNNRVWPYIIGIRPRKKWFWLTVKKPRGKRFGLNSGLNYVRRRWLIVSVLLLAVAAVILYWILVRDFGGDVKSLTTAQLTRKLLASAPKVLALLVVLLPLRFAIKNYNASSHLRTIYKHKSVAVRTLEGYTANMDAPSQNEVRKLIAPEIFGTPETGYISRNDGANATEVPLEYLLTKISRND